MAAEREVALQRHAHRRLVVHHQNAERVGHRAHGWRRLRLTARARRDDRQLDQEARASLARVLRPDATLVLAHDAEGDREPEPRPRAGGLGGEERVEDALEQVGRDARPRVLHLDPDHVARAERPHRQALLVALRALHRLLGVGDQVQEHLLELVRVRHRFGDLLVVVPHHVDSPHPELVAPELQRVVQHLIDRGRGPLRLVLAREGQEVLHDAGGAPRLGVDHLGRRALVRPEALLGEQQLGERRDPGERVVQLVRHAGDELPDRGHLLRLDELLLQHRLVRHVADDAEHLLVHLRRRVGDLDRADLAVFAVEGGLEQAGLAGQRLLEVGQRLGELVVAEHRGEPLTHQLLAAVGRDDLGGVVDRREPAVGVERHDGVRRRLEQIAVAGLRAGQRLLRAVLLRDVPQRGHRAEQLALHHEGGGGDGHDALFPRARDDPGLEALFLARERAPLALGHVLALARGDEVVDRGARKVVERPAEQLGGGAVGGEDAAIAARHDDRVGQGGHEVRRHPQQVEAGPLRLGLRRRGIRPRPPGARSAPALAHGA